MSLTGDRTVMLSDEKARRELKLTRVTAREASRRRAAMEASIVVNYLWYVCKVFSFGCYGVVEKILLVASLLLGPCQRPSPLLVVHATARSGRVKLHPLVTPCENGFCDDRIFHKFGQIGMRMTVHAHRMSHEFS